MTSELMEAILTKLNSCLAHTNQRILLLMDNAGCHPPHLETMFKNITIFFCLQTLFKEAIASLEEVQHFLERKGQLAVSFEVGSILDSVAAMQSKSLTQRSLFDYFSRQ